MVITATAGANVYTTTTNVSGYYSFTLLPGSYTVQYGPVPASYGTVRPTGGSNFSDIMHSLKPNFTKEYKQLIGVSGRMNFWQKGFWDHVIRNESDFQRHLDYIHYNPVHHALADKPESWPHSSFPAWQQRRAYPERWGWATPNSLAAYDWNAVEADHDK